MLRWLDYDEGIRLVRDVGFVATDENGNNGKSDKDDDDGDGWLPNVVMM